MEIPKIHAATSFMKDDAVRQGGNEVIVKSLLDVILNRNTGSLRFVVQHPSGTKERIILSFKRARGNTRTFQIFSS